MGFFRSIGNAVKKIDPIGNAIVSKATPAIHSAVEPRRFAQAGGQAVKYAWRAGLVVHPAGPYVAAAMTLQEKRVAARKATTLAKRNKKQALAETTQVEGRVRTLHDYLGHYVGTEPVAINPIQDDLTSTSTLGQGTNAVATSLFPANSNADAGGPVKAAPADRGRTDAERGPTTQTAGFPLLIIGGLLLAAMRG